jgi:hypothetical protein
MNIIVKFIAVRVYLFIDAQYYSDEFKYHEILIQISVAR